MTAIFTCVYFFFFETELVRNNSVPLCSDAFWERQGFQSLQEAEQNNQDVIDATNRLLEDVITKFAEDLNSHKVQLNDHFQLIRKLHERGINVRIKFFANPTLLLFFFLKVRYVGLLRKKLKIEYLQTFLLTEMACRVIKNLLRADMRDLQSRTSDETEFNKLVVNHFNLVLGVRDISKMIFFFIKIELLDERNPKKVKNIGEC